MRRSMRLGVMGILLACATGATACDMVKFQGVVKTTTTDSEGRTVTKERHVDRIEDMPAAIADGWSEFGNATAEMIEKLTEAPPPGTVKLSDLNPALGRYEGRQGYDFLIDAKDDEGKPIEFKYVQIGVPSYDQFFKTTAEMYALLYQTKMTIAKLRSVSGAVIGGEVDLDGELGALVDEAKSKVDGSGSAKGSMLADYSVLAGTLAANTAALAGKTSELVATGQQLIAGAPTSIADPRTLLHIDLIIEGLEASVDLIGESGELLGEIATDVAPLEGDALEASDSDVGSDEPDGADASDGDEAKDEDEGASDEE